ncbi:uncharacterized protein LOC112500006 [Cynara cardunculus var. scolymus]|uniref:uncharacterized protein LOC112500006 n=1 Tax=Cynara cardunculus var. scolymus TaxID=59895 RepID=UPI000D62F9B6|nr:uncharacterized protein LOC112500006 [Cynara cardunculus var. scolymus]
MGDKFHDNQEVEEVLDTLSLTDFPTTQHQDHRNPPSPPPSPSPLPTEEYFEFFSGDLGDYPEDKMMSHAEDIIFCGKLVPINEQHHRQKPPPQRENNHHHRQPYLCRRSESMSEVKSPPASELVRTSRSLDYKKLHRNTSMSSEPPPEIGRDGSGKKPSSRWYVFFFGLVKVLPPEMDLQDMKNRQVRRTTSKTLVSSSESGDVGPVNRSGDHQKCSWRVLGFLSCKSSASAAVTTPLHHIPKV